MYRDQLEFWGLKVLPGKPQPVSFDDNEEALVHITQARGTHRCVATLAVGGGTLLSVWLESVVVWGTAVLPQPPLSTTRDAAPGDPVSPPLYSLVS